MLDNVIIATMRMDAYEANYVANNYGNYGFGYAWED